MSLCWPEILRTMGSLFCYLIILQVLCCTFVLSDLQNNNALRDEFVNSNNSVLQSVWRKEPSIICNVPKPPETSLENKIFLSFSFDQFLCVILYDISYRFAHMQSVERYDYDSEKLAQMIVENSPPPENFCQKMKDNDWSTSSEENSKWFQKFNDVMKNPTLCNKYCVEDVVNPLCAYILWLDSSIKVKLQNNLPTFSDDHESHEPLKLDPLKHQLYVQEHKKSQVRQFALPHVPSKPSGIQINIHSPPMAEANHFKSNPTAISLSTLVKGLVKASTNIGHLGSNADLLAKQSSETATGVQSSQASPDPKPGGSRLLSISNQQSDNQSPKQPYHNLADVDNAVSGQKKAKPNVLALQGGRIEENKKGDEENMNIPLIEQSKIQSASGNEKNIKPSSLVANTAASNNLQHKAEMSTDTNDDMLDKNDQYTGKDDEQIQITTNGNKNVDPGEDVKSENTPKFASSKPDHMKSAIPEVKQPSSETKVNKKENKQPSGTRQPSETHQPSETNLPPETKTKPQTNLELDDGNTADEGISNGIGVIETDNHEIPKAMEETEGRDEVDSVAENPEDQSEMDVTSPTHFVGENGSPPVKPNTSPKMSDFGDDLSDEDPAMPMNEDAEKGTQNDADAGIYVHDRFVDAEDSHFFAYFMTMIILCILGYLIFHNKQKILALALEGRVRKGNRRRPSTSGYRKLDSNLEEAVTSNCSGASVTHVIY